MLFGSRYKNFTARLKTPVYNIEKLLDNLPYGLPNKLNLRQNLSWCGMRFRPWPYFW